MITEQNISLEDRQKALEEECVGLGVLRYRQERMPWKVDGSPRDVQESETIPGTWLLKKHLKAVAEAIKEWTSEATSAHGGARRGANRAGWIAQFDPDVVAFVALKQCINSLTKKTTLPQVATGIASWLADVQDLENFTAGEGDQEAPAGIDEEHHKRRSKAYAAKVVESAKKNTRYNRRREIIHAGMDTLGVKRVELDTAGQVGVGLVLVHIVCEITGVVEVVREKVGAKKMVSYVQPTPEGIEWLTNQHNRCEVMYPLYLPMVSLPKPWKGPEGGGYLTKALSSRVRLVRTTNRNYLEEFANTASDGVYTAVNALQETPWAIRGNVLDVLRQCVDSETNLGQLPAMSDLPMPAKPSFLDQGRDRSDFSPEETEIFLAWKRKAAAVYSGNANAVRKRLKILQQMWIADKFIDEDAIYFPHTMDWRGRIYPQSSLVTPQADDLGKGLLEFANGVALGAEGATWLAIHLANTFGFDKASLEDRQKWTLDHADLILDSALNPLDGERFWDKADKPWQFLAACFDWLGYTMEGESFVSHLPIGLDGSCSGIQHFSAMLRDEIGGAQVNLTPSDKPQDIYQRVADRVNRVLADMAAADVDTSMLAWGETSSVDKDTYNTWLARQWAGKVTRAIAKRPVMTLPYGATRPGMKDQIEQVLDKLEAEKGEVFEGDNWVHATFLSGVIYSAIGDVVIAARDAMDWLQKAAKVVAKDGLSISWVTPAGFPVQQEYRKSSTKTLDLMFGGIRIQTRIDEKTDEIDPRKMAASVSPNFVHSMDASHLMLTVCQSLRTGIKSFAMVHDSYATHAGNTQELAMTLREVFVEMYSQDVLGDFRDQLLAMAKDESEIPELPAKGTLELSSVIDSLYFFA